MSSFENRYLNVAEMMREAMTENPNLKVMIANGYYDLATPFFATEYTVNHLGLEPALSSHVGLTYCEAGPHAVHEEGLPGQSAQVDDRLLSEGAADSVAAARNRFWVKRPALTHASSAAPNEAQSSIKLLICFACSVLEPRDTLGTAEGRKIALGMCTDWERYRNKSAR